MRPGLAEPLGLAAQRGFTFLGLMFGIAVLGIALATVGIVWSTEIRRDKEAELLWVGNQYRLAIMRYRATGGTFPTDLSDLIEDKRFPVPKRYLRKLYPDPMTGQADWELITVPNGAGIMGIASSSHDKPIKVDNFEPANEEFKDAECYCDWRFMFNARGRRVHRAIRPSGTG